MSENYFTFRKKFFETENDTSELDTHHNTENGGKYMYGCYLSLGGVYRINHSWVILGEAILLNGIASTAIVVPP